MSHVTANIASIEANADPQFELLDVCDQFLSQPVYSQIQKCFFLHLAVQNI